MLLILYGTLNNTCRFKVSLILCYLFPYHTRVDLALISIDQPTLKVTFTQLNVAKSSNTTNFSYTNKQYNNTSTSTLYMYGLFYGGYLPSYLKMTIFVGINVSLNAKILYLLMLTYLCYYIVEQSTSLSTLYHLCTNHKIQYMQNVLAKNYRNLYLHCRKTRKTHPQNYKILNNE